MDLPVANTNTKAIRLFPWNSALLFPSLAPMRPSLLLQGGPQAELQWAGFAATILPAWALWRDESFGCYIDNTYLDSQRLSVM